MANQRTGQKQKPYPTFPGNPAPTPPPSPPPNRHNRVGLPSPAASKAKPRSSWNLGSGFRARGYGWAGAGPVFRLGPIHGHIGAQSSGISIPGIGGIVGPGISRLTGGTLGTVAKAGGIAAAAAVAAYETVKHGPSVLSFLQGLGGTPAVAAISPVAALAGPDATKKLLNDLFDKVNTLFLKVENLTKAISEVNSMFNGAAVLGMKPTLSGAFGAGEFLTNLGTARDRLKSQSDRRMSQEGSRVLGEAVGDWLRKTFGGAGK
jgi:hypothetical protein